MAKTRAKGFIPAAGHDWLLPLYDPLHRWVVGEGLARALVAQADIGPDQRVLDIGCGTGIVTLLARRTQPGAEVVGLDPDPKALAIARRKSEKSGVAARFERGFAHDLPHPPGSFDRVLSSFMFHHLAPDEKVAALREVRRVLRPGGSLHLMDFGPPRSRYARLVAHLMGRSEHLRDNVEGRIPSLLGESGFAQAEEVAHRTTAFGAVSRFRAVEPPTRPGG